MSAWIVSDNHIRLLAQAVTLYLDALCTDLLRENYASVNYRYGANEEAPAIRYEPVYGGEDPRAFKVTVLKSIHCYRYQSCEHPGWKTSTIKGICDRLHDAIRATIDFTPGRCENQSLAGKEWECCECHQIPGYDAAPWAFDGWA